MKKIDQKDSWVIHENFSTLHNSSSQNAIPHSQNLVKYFLLNLVYSIAKPTSREIFHTCIQRHVAWRYLFSIPVILISFWAPALNLISLVFWADLLSLSPSDPSRSLLVLYIIIANQKINHVCSVMENEEGGKNPALIREVDDDSKGIEWSEWISFERLRMYFRSKKKIRCV